MALTPIPNNGSQLERAAGAWLVDVTASNAVGFRIKPEWIYVTSDYRERATVTDEPIITLLASSFEPNTQFSGDREWRFTINLKFKAKQQPGATDPQFNRILIDRYIGLIEAAMAQTNNNQNLDTTKDGITNSGRALKTNGITTPSDWRNQSANQDMDAFTCIFVNHEFSGVRGHPDNEETGGPDMNYWVESRTWRITACPDAL